MDYPCWSSKMIAKVLFIVFFVEFASGNHLYGLIGESYHAPQPYKFGYQVKDKDSAQHRHEESDGNGNVRGSYGYTDDKGQYREVHYVADKNGFRAQVKTNEAGTANQSPADVDVKADPPQHHLQNHHAPLHIPHHEEIKFHHHVPHHEEIKFNHHVPHYEEIKFNHHVPQHEEIKFNHHIPHHEEIKFSHHVPHHEEIKFHVPSHHEFKVQPFQHHHGFKNHQHFSIPLASHGFNNFSPLHGFSYNPSAFHGYGQWPFQDSNVYGKQQTSWKEPKGYGFNLPHHGGNVQGFKSLSSFDGDFDSLSSNNKDKYEEIMEKIKAYKKDGALSLLGRFKSDVTDNFDNNVKNWKYGHENFNF